jgi:two-component system, OmpR family, sensor kinase
MSNAKSHAMGQESVRAAEEPTSDRYLRTLERLLAIQTVDLRHALNEAALLLSEVLAADKIDIFLLEPATQTLVALGVSNTPMGRHQRAIGLDRQPLANGGSAVAVFTSGLSYSTGHAEANPDELRGVIEELGARSLLTVPLTVGEERRGVLQAADREVDRFTALDLPFLEAVARWMGSLTQRTELVEQIAQQAAAAGRQLAAEELVTTLAHDLRNYITPLRARVEFLARRARREQRLDDLRDATEALAQLDRFLRLIKDLLDVARIEQGLLGLNPQLTDLAALIQQAVDAVQQPGVAISVATPDLLPGEVDADRLRQAVENLVANALHHSPPGAAVAVTVDQEVRDDGPWAVILVHDEGPGIPPATRPHLFERFQHGPGSQGLGLGLYLARQIAQAHGGDLTLADGYQTGAHFQLAVPIQRHCL